MEPRRPLAAFLVSYAQVAGAVTAGIGLVVLVGWISDVALLKSLVVTLATMKANTALAFVFAGASLWLLSMNKPGPGLSNARAHSGAGATAWLTALLGAVTLSQDLLGWNAGIDELLFDDPASRATRAAPGRMSVATSLSFTLLGAGLVAANSSFRGSARVAQGLATFVVLVSGVALLGYVLNVSALYQVRPFSSMALHTAVAFFLCGLGLVALRHSSGWARELTAATVSGQFGRRLVLVVCIALPALAWLRVRGQNAGLYGTEVGTGLLVAASLLLVIVVIWLGTRAANLAEGRIHYLNRTLSVLSQINALIVRVQDRDELFRQACAIATETGRFRFVWLGLLDEQAKLKQPVSYAGSDANALRPLVDLISFGSSPDIVVALRNVTDSRRPAIVNRLNWRQASAFERFLLASDIRSFALLPLVVNQRTIGVLGLYGDTPNQFDEQEERLLQEVAGDIAFACEHLEKEQALQHLALYDPVTALANPTLLGDRLRQHADVAAALNHQFALVIYDIDRFKMINDTFGRSAGDEVLRTVAGRLQQILHEPGRLARIGANRFAAILPQIRTENDALRAHELLVEKCFDTPMLVGEESIRLAVKAGIAVYPDDGPDATALFNNAEAALKKARDDGEPFLFYRPQINREIGDRLRLENRLREAIDKNQFVLHYQPKVDARTRELTGLEALMRWQEADGSLVPPGRFIELLEETALILDAGEWALHQVARDCARWKQAGAKPTSVAVNVSPLQLRQQEFVQTVMDAAQRLEGTGFTLELEITESMIMEDLEDTIRKLRIIRGLEIGVSIDDFGTGYSSLAYIARLPITSLKIDRSFVIAIDTSKDSLAIVKAIISLAHSLKLVVIAEGVETEEQATQLRKLGCDEIQGYLVAKPMPPDAVIEFFAES